MKDDVGHWVNTGETQCEECHAEPGQEHARGCVTGNRDIAVDTPPVRRTLAKLAQAYAEQRKASDAVRTYERELAEQGFTRAVLQAASKEAALSGRLREKADTAHAIARAAFGAPLQIDAFDE